MESLRLNGSFTRAGTGQDAGVQNAIRRDEIHWIERENSSPMAQKKIWEKIDSLRQAFNRTLFLGLGEFEGHYASYPVGGFYQRHLDCFHEDDSRTVSLIIYLNKDWQPADGGQLRIYGKDSSHDIDPKGGTLVCFLSRESEHEVLESHAERNSFSGWFRQADRLSLRDSNGLPIGKVMN